MKKYLITSAAALALCGLITSCTHDIDGLTPEESVTATYEKAFITAFGQPAPDQTWGFGTSVATTRGTTRAEMYGFTVPANPTFSNKDGITEPSTIDKPTINKDGATVISGTNNEWTGINAGSTVYLEENAVLKLYDQWNPNNSISLQNVNLYMSKGSRLEVPTGLYISGTTNLVNDEGSIVIGSDNNQKNIWFDNLTGTFWNNGSITGIYDMGTSNDGGTIYFGSKSSFTARNLSLNKDVRLWNEGTITLSGNFTTAACDNYGHRIYNSGTITTNNLEFNKKCTLWNEGSFTTTGGLTCNNPNNYIYVGQQGYLKVASLTLNTDPQLLLNEGTLEVEGAIYGGNGSPEIVNYGTLTGASLELLAGAQFHNTGYATISGRTHVANSQTEWKNEGTFITEDFDITDYAVKVWNCCKMIVHKSDDSGEFKILGSFVLDRGASVKTDKVHWVNTSDVYMKGLSLFKVLGDFITNNYDCNYGMHACDDEWAVVQAGAIKQYDNANNQFRMSYYGNLWVDTDSHFELWYKDQPSNTNQPNYKFYGNAKLGHEGDPDCPVIPSENTGGRNYSCTPGYNETHEPEGDVVRVVAEDLTASAGNDFDFNDVVFDVELKDNNVVYVYVRAAGGTLPLYLGEEDEAVEVHGLFGQDTGIMINTGGTTKGYANCIDNLAPKGISLRNPLAGQADATNVRQVAKAIKVVVIKNVNGTSTPCELKAEQGEATAKLCVGTDYQYTEGGKTYPCLTERTDIKGQFIYNSDLNSIYRGQGKFPLYVKGIFDDDWYKETAEPEPQSNN